MLNINININNIYIKFGSALLLLVLLSFIFWICSQYQILAMFKNLFKKPDWLDLSEDEKLDIVLKDMGREQRKRKYGDDYEEYDENDTPEIKEVKIFRDVSRLLRKRNKKNQI
jgi:hypothetical protein